MYYILPAAGHFCPQIIHRFTVVRLFAWPLNETEADVDLVLIETSRLFLC